MSREPRWRDDERAVQLALFRYGVIAPLVEAGELPRGGVSALVRALFEETHYLPGHGPLRVAERTIYDWYADYRQGGIDALRPRPRKDRGSLRVLDEETLARAVQLRKEGENKRKTRTLLDILEREGTLAGKPVPHRATLDRHLARLGASRRRLGVLGTQRTIRMHFEHFGDLWVGDYHHGPLVLAPSGQPTTAKLGAFIDHATRYPVADAYYLAEDLPTLRDTLLRALLKWGKPRKVYVDRGAVYRSAQLAYSLQHIGTILVHSRAYYSQGRGVIERWWETIAPFEEEVRLRDELLTIHELNRLWEAYRELRYCAEVHSELGKSPNEAVAAVEPKPLDPAVARELFLVTARRDVHRKDGCVSVEGRRFLCESWLRGQTVTVCYDPGQLDTVLIFCDGKRVQRALPQQANARPEPAPTPEKLAQSVDYLGLLRQDYDRRLLEHARPLAYARLTPSAGFDGEQFVAAVAKLAGLAPRPAEERELRAFWDQFQPVPEPLVRIATEHAVRLHGRHRHPQVYLHAIRTLILAEWRNPDKEDSK